MQRIFQLSKENLEIAKDEVGFLIKKKYCLKQDLLIADSETSLKERLAYTHREFKFLFLCNRSGILEKINTFSWDKVYEDNFCIRCHGKDRLQEKEIAELIWGKLKDPKVDLAKPKTRFDFFFFEKDCIAGLYLGESDKSYLHRKAHDRPSLHPVSMSPRLARAMVNLTGMDHGTIIDPFCGTGGILIEAGLMGFEIIGYDILEDMVQRSKTNLLYCGVNKFFIEKKDARTISGKFDAIVTDFPYGKSSKAKNLEELYLSFLKKARSCTKLAVIGFPDFFDSKKAIDLSGWCVKSVYKIYIHKSLSKIIYVLI